MIGQIIQSAGLQGTTICVEKLFSNTPHRLASIIRQTAEEANRIADLIVKFNLILIANILILYFDRFAMQFTAQMWHLPFADWMQMAMILGVQGKG